MLDPPPAQTAGLAEILGGLSALLFCLSVYGSAPVAGGSPNPPSAVIARVLVLSSKLRPIPLVTFHFRRGAKYQGSNQAALT